MIVFKYFIELTDLSCESILSKNLAGMSRRDKGREMERT
jgi:hypothetical protein